MKAPNGRDASTNLSKDGRLGPIERERPNDRYWHFSNFPTVCSPQLLSKVNLTCNSTSRTRPVTGFSDVSKWVCL
jgi:hypothetical protein